MSEITITQNKDNRVSNLPAVNVKDLHGKTVNTSNFINGINPILLIFWISTYKVPSRQLDVIQDNYSEWKRETGVKTIVIAVDDSRTSSHVLPIINGKQWEFEFYLDNNSDFKRAMNVNNLPHTILLQPSGEIVWQHAGFIDGQELLIYKELKKILNDKIKDDN